MAEHRKHVRSPVRLDGSWSVVDRPRLDVLCRDISLGGCFLEAPSQPALGTVILVHLDLPGLRDQAGRPAAATILSRVRWTTPHGMGVQFGTMGARETAALLDLLRAGPRTEVA